jgi:CDP-diacylglycerol--glycerol-3-phosphate 3-phosphatidyltransferase
MVGEAGGLDPRESAADAPDSGHRIDEGLRWFGDFFFRPALWFFEKLRISPNLITVLATALAIGSGYCLAVKRVPLAAVLFTLAGVLDIVDGYVAKKLGKVTVFGSFLDSFSDRIADAAIYLGLMVYFLKIQEGVYAGLAIVLLVASFLISYLRARAETLGLECKAGLMARAPRFLALGFGLYFNGLSPWILKIVVWIVAALMIETLVERFIFVWRKLET